MKERFIIATVALVFLFISLAIGSTRISAQQPTPTPSAPVPVPTFDVEHRFSDIERRIAELEDAQEQTIDFNQRLLTGAGLFIAVVTIFQVTATALQLRREGKREARQATREEKQDLTERMGIDQVSRIMNVVQQTLESRLAAEKEAREEAARASEQVKEIRKEIRIVDDFLEKYQGTIRNAQQDIEDTASRLAQTDRQGFRPKINELNSYNQKVDTFETSLEPLAVEKRSFSPNVPYIRGIAAHFANQPERAKKYLLEVVGLHQPQPGETEIDYNRRVANAYYYLGLMESNFGNYRNAIDYFDRSKHLDPKGEDLLTRVLTADTFVMNKEFDQAMPFVTGVEKELAEIEQREGRLRNPDQRLRSRIALIKASVAIMNRQANWHEEALQILKSVHGSDPLYYYATTALAQVYMAQGDASHAQEFFREAYQTIEHSGDLITVTEVRIRILLLMVAGMCCKHGLKDEKSSEAHLEKADALRARLPKMGEKYCTVFSPLSKLNEDSQIIHQHIGLIRKGDVLVDQVDDTG